MQPNYQRMYLNLLDTFRYVMYVLVDITTVNTFCCGCIIYSSNCCRNRGHSVARNLRLNYALEEDKLRCISSQFLIKHLLTYTVISKYLVT